MGGGPLSWMLCPELQGQDAGKWSRHFLGVDQVFKQSAGHYLHYLDYSTTGDQEAWLSLCAYAANWWSKDQWKQFSMVKQSKPFFRQSKSCGSGCSACGSDPPCRMYAPSNWHPWARWTINLYAVSIFSMFA